MLRGEMQICFIVSHPMKVFMYVCFTCFGSITKKVIYIYIVNSFSSNITYVHKHIYYYKRCSIDRHLSVEVEVPVDLCL